MHYLFICTGNTCRSPMAEGMYNARATFLGLPLSESAGIAVRAGDEPNIHAIRAAARYGADITYHKARQVTRELIEAADAVICMTAGHVAALGQDYPEFAEKIRIIAPDGISDPFGGDLDDYIACAASMDAAIRRLANEAKRGR